MLDLASNGFESLRPLHLEMFACPVNAADFNSVETNGLRLVGSTPIHFR